MYNGTLIRRFLYIILFQDKILRMNELTSLRKQIEREYAEKVELEDQIMEKMRSHLTMDKAAKYTKKLTGKLRTQTKSLVCIVFSRNEENNYFRIFSTSWSICFRIPRSSDILS